MDTVRMIWKEIKTWATNKGYKVDRKSIGVEEKKYIYSWAYNDVEGIAHSTNECAIVLYNHMTNNKFVEYQKEYEKTKVKEDIFIAGVTQW